MDCTKVTHFSSLPATMLDVPQHIRKTIMSYLQRCNIPYVKIPLAADFRKACIDEAINLGCPMEGADSFEPYVIVGAVIAYAAYAHLNDRAAQIYIAVYTGIMTYYDDNFERHIGSLSQFNKRFVRGEKQNDTVLQSLSQLLLELPQRYGPIVSNMITTSTLNFVTALLLECETQDMPLSKDAYGYPTFARTMSGISEAYAHFIFPPDCPTQSYIQAFPEMMSFINGTNDVLSFYKEELAEEKSNYVTFLAACHGMTKIEAFEQLSNECVQAHERILRLLRPHRIAYEAWLGFAQGYVSFHAGLTRYKLDELNL